MVLRSGVGVKVRVWVGLRVGVELWVGVEVSLYTTTELLFAETEEVPPWKFTEAELDNKVASGVAGFTWVLKLKV